MRFATTLVVVAGLAFLAGERFASRGNGAAIARADSLQRDLRAAEAQTAQLALTDSARADTIRQYERLTARLEARRPVMQHRTDTLIVAIADSGLRDTLTAAIQAERVTADSIIAAGQATIRLLESRLLQAQDEATRYRLMAAEFNQRLQEAVRQPRARSILRDVGLLAGGLLGGYLLTR